MKKYFQASLTELNISGNCIASLTSIQCLGGITHLDVSNNLISDINEVCSTVRKLKNLKSLQIEKNPINKNKRYESDIIASSQALGIRKLDNLEKPNFREILKKYNFLATINNRAVSTTNRVFIQTLRAVQMLKDRRKRNKKRTKSSETKSKTSTIQITKSNKLFFNYFILQVSSTDYHQNLGTLF